MLVIFIAGYIYCTESREKLCIFVMLQLHYFSDHHFCESFHLSVVSYFKYLFLVLLWNQTVVHITAALCLCSSLISVYISVLFSVLYVCFKHLNIKGQHS